VRLAHRVGRSVIVIVVAMLGMALGASAGEQQRPSSSPFPSARSSPIPSTQSSRSPSAHAIQTNRHPNDVPAGQTPARNDPAAIARWSQALFWTIVLLIAFCFAAAAIVVFSRRFRAYLTRRRPEPTQYVDAWSLHRLPPEPQPDSRDLPGAAGDEPSDDRPDAGPKTGN